MRVARGPLRTATLVLGLVSFTAFVQLLLMYHAQRRAAPDAEHRAAADGVAYEPRPVRPALGGSLFRVAIGGAISSKGIERLDPDTVQRLPAFSALFPSFCRTASPGFLYHFYFGYDYDDALAAADFREAFVAAFDSQMAASCGWLPERPRLHLLECPHRGKPAWAQNDAMVAAYVDGSDFFYRLNDDTLLMTANWTAVYVGRLGRLTPQYVGAVGPSCKRGPRAGILTHDFVHRTHVEIFGHYYPRLFTDWYADNWITHVYEKNARALVLDDVLVNHTETLGRRYRVLRNGTHMELLTNATAREDHKLVERYVKMFLPEGQPTSCGHRRRCSLSVIVYGNDTRQTLGAIRNAQLAQVIYPGWRLRVYYHPKPWTTANPTEASFADLYVPDNVLRTLEILGAELVPVTDQRWLGNPRTWRRLVIEDSINDEFVSIWQADSPLLDKGDFFAS